MQPTLHTLPPPPKPQCCPDGQSASVLQGSLMQPASLPGEQLQLKFVHSHTSERGAVLTLTQPQLN